MTKSKINWHIFSLLLAMTLFSVIAVFPYVLTLQGDILKQTNISVLTIFIAQVVQSIILFSIAIFFGLHLMKKISFQTPLFEAMLAKKEYKTIAKKILAISIPFGIVTAFAIYMADKLFSFFGSPIDTSQNLAPIWQKLLASFYGGITEEVLLRLFLMSLFVWLGMKLTKVSSPTNIGVIIPIVLSSIIFGLGHLPITASLTQITATIVIRAIVLNGIGGVIFGWLFWKKGLEAAIIAHFTADIFLLTIFPLLLK